MWHCKMRRNGGREIFVCTRFKDIECFLMNEVIYFFHSFTHYAISDYGYRRSRTVGPCFRYLTLLFWPMSLSQY